jgi:hypothetical protein
MAEGEASLRGEQARRVRLATEALLVGVAVAGLSGVASLLQAGFEWGEVPTGILVAITLSVWQANRREG